MYKVGDIVLRTGGTHSVGSTARIITIDSPFKGMCYVEYIEVNNTGSFNINMGYKASWANKFFTLLEKRKPDWVI
jgi:hypothetical protein